MSEKLRVRSVRIKVSEPHWRALKIEALQRATTPATLLGWIVSERYTVKREHNA